MSMAKKWGVSSPPKVEHSPWTTGPWSGLPPPAWPPPPPSWRAPRPPSSSPPSLSSSAGARVSPTGPANGRAPGRCRTRRSCWRWWGWAAPWPGPRWWHSTSLSTYPSLNMGPMSWGWLRFEGLGVMKDTQCHEAGSDSRDTVSWGQLRYEGHSVMTQHKTWICDTELETMQCHSLCHHGTWQKKMPTTW